MNKLFLTFAMTAIAVVSVPAYAGRDAGQIMEQNKANTAVAEQSAQEKARTGKAATRIVLPLDHGPHAQTTPWANKQRLLRAEAFEKNATEGGAVGK